MRGQKRPLRIRLISDAAVSQRNSKKPKHSRSGANKGCRIRQYYLQFRHARTRVEVDFVVMTVSSSNRSYPPGATARSLL
jgi:hypothetical protein